VDKLPVLIDSKNYIYEYEYTLKAVNLLFLNKMDFLKSSMYGFQSLTISGEYSKSKLLSLPIIKNITNLIPENAMIIDFIISYYIKDNNMVEIQLNSENYDDIITVNISEIEVIILLKYMINDKSLYISDSDDIPYRIKDIDYFLIHLAGMNQGRPDNTKEILINRKEFMLKNDDYNIG
jgi:hypothetical protein